VTLDFIFASHSIAIRTTATGRFFASYPFLIQTFQTQKSKFLKALKGYILTDFFYKKNL